MSLHAYSAEGNLDVRYNSASWGNAFSTIATIPPGRWYFEAYAFSQQGAVDWEIGLARNDFTAKGQNMGLEDEGSYCYSKASGTQSFVWNNGTPVSYDSKYIWDNKDTVGLGYDTETGVVEFFLNGELKGGDLVIDQADRGSVGFAVAMYNYNGWLVNFGQRDWTYPPPADYRALCTDNLPRATIIPKDHFGATKWTGDGVSPRTIDTGINAGLVWLKDRTNGNHHYLVDTVRGTGLDKALYADLQWKQKVSSNSGEESDQ